MSAATRTGSELMARIARLRSELNEIERLIRSKAEGRVLSDLRDRTNDLENEVVKEEK
jgi:hypothetical protein